jgi:hypothetical protein
MIFKYIITDFGAILFNEATTHSMVAEGFIKEGKKIYSAGFCIIKDGFVREVYGRSESLDMESHPDIDFGVISNLFSVIAKYLPKDINQLYK